MLDRLGHHELGCPNDPLGLNFDDMPPPVERHLILVPAPHKRQVRVLQDLFADKMKRNGILLTNGPCSLLPLDHPALQRHG